MQNDLTNQISEILADNKKAKMTAIVFASDLKLFITYFHYHLYHQEFIFKPFHLEIIKHFENIVFDQDEIDKKDTMINLVPRYGKSLLVQYFIAWSFAINRNSNFIYTSYSDNLVLGFSDKIKQVINSELFGRLYGLTFNKSEESKRKWSIENGGGLYAVSQGGAVTGFGAGNIGDEYAGALIIDDAIKPEDAKSPTMRAKVISYFEETLSNRVNNPKKTPIILIMHRLNFDDLCGHLLKQEPDRWNVLKFPAYDEEKKEAIWPEKHDVEYLERLKRINPNYYYAQFQQNPLESDTMAVFRAHEISYYDNLPQFDTVIQSWDTAFKANTQSDYSCCTTWGEKKTQFGSHYYLIDVWRGRVEYPQLKAKFIDLQNRFNPYIILVEDKASGQSLLQDLKQAGNNKLRAVKVDTDKISRATAPSAMFESGCVFLPRESNWLSEFIDEMLTFPNCDHDDQVDSMNQALNHFNKPKGFIGVF